MNYDDIVENLIVSRVDVGGHKEDLRKLEALKAVLKNIPTEKGKKYALSKFLNETPGYEFNELKASNPNLDEDYWSLKHQDDYIPPDVEKTLEKANKENAENFWNWDSDEHWSKRSTDELKRQADRAGYGNNLPGYLDKVRETQVQRDRDNLFNDVPGTIAKIAYPRASEAVMRGDDIQAKDIGLDLGEQALYSFNPGGRAAALLTGGAKAGKAAKAASYLADIASNPAIMEYADAVSYDDPNNVRSEFNPADVAIGAGINAGMNKIVNKYAGKLVAPRAVPKKLQTEISMKVRKGIAAEKSKATRDSKGVVNEMLKAHKNGEDITPYLQKLEDLQLIQNKPNPKKEFRDRTIKDYIPEVKKAGIYETVPLVSNKAGDLISEDPRMTRSIISRAVRVPGVPQIVGDLVNDYYKLKDKNVEQDKINQAIRLLGKEK